MEEKRKLEELRRKQQEEERLRKELQQKQVCAAEVNHLNFKIVMQNIVFPDFDAKPGS